MLTLRLFHGRRSPDEQLSDWGRDGPTLGPLRSVNATYCEELRLETTDGELIDLTVIRGLVYYGGVFYGDFEISNELVATEQANDPRAELGTPAFVKALRDWSECEGRVRVSKRFAAIASVFIDAVRENEGESVANKVHTIIERTVTSLRIPRDAARGAVDLEESAAACEDADPQSATSNLRSVPYAVSSRTPVDRLRRRR